MSFEELTVDSYHRSLTEGAVTTEQLVRWYLDRINAHDRSGAQIGAIVTVNDAAIDEAVACDQYLATHGALSGRLHGVPVLVKDQAETAGIRTTFGSKVFEDHIPERDATLVRRIKEEGGIVLAKTSMCDLAAGWFSSSSMTGHTRNVYDPARDSGGSSAGTGAGISANFGLVGVGEDTGGSIRIPASFGNVYGMRVTTGLISRDGFSPLVHFQDTPGPMARTVGDLARLLDVLVGYDPLDPYTSVAWPQPPSYVDALDEDVELADWRIGVLESAFGASDQAEPVSALTRAAIEQLRTNGLGVVPGVEIDELQNWIADTSLYLKQSKSDLTSFLEARPKAPAKSFMDIYKSGQFHPENDLFHGVADGPDTPDDDPEYHRLRLNQERFRRSVMNVFAQHRISVLVYPTVQVLAPTHEDLAAGKFPVLAFPTNTVIGSQTGMPSISIPIGFTTEGLPVGMEILGLPFEEANLLKFAAAVEQCLHARKAPVL